MTVVVAVVQRMAEKGDENGGAATIWAASSALVLVAVAPAVAGTDVHTSRVHGRLLPLG